MYLIIQTDKYGVPLFDAGYALYSFAESRDIPYLLHNTNWENLKALAGKQVFCGSIK